MKSLLKPGLMVLAGLTTVSCYPMPEDRHIRNNRPPEQTITSREQQEIKEQRDRMKERDKQLADERKQENSRPAPKNERESAPENTPAPQPKTTKDYAFAQPVPGKEGFVLSPYNQKIVDVRDIPSGTLVQDPTYPPSEKKYFRVP